MVNTCWSRERVLQGSCIHAISAALLKEGGWNSALKGAKQWSPDDTRCFEVIALFDQSQILNNNQSQRRSIPLLYERTNKLFITLDLNDTSLNLPRHQIPTCHTCAHVPSILQTVRRKCLLKTKTERKFFAKEFAIIELKSGMNYAKLHNHAAFNTQ